MTSANPTLVEAARTLGASPRQVMAKVLRPGAVPSIVVVVRIGWMTLVAAEFTSLRLGHGLGYMIMTARDLMRADQIMAGRAVIGLVGLSIDSGIHLLQRRLLPWL